MRASPKAVRTVAIMSPGDMGHAIGRMLKQHQLNVITCLQGRSSRTHQLSDAAGIRTVESMEQLVHQADMILSILAPANAMAAAQEVATAIGQQQVDIHFVECNAVSPSTALHIAQIVRGSKVRYSDGGIIGFPPSSTSLPVLYVSGPDAAEVACLDGKGMAVKVIGPDIGQASGLKMCYAALTKGTFALYYAALLAAQHLNLLEELVAELASSQSSVLQRMQENLPKLPAKAWRWIGEMQEIAHTFEDAGMPPGFHQAAAEVYRLVSQSPVGRETPETIDLSRTLQETIAMIALRKA